VEWPAAPFAVVLTDDDRVVNSSWAATTAKEWLGRDAVVMPGSHSPFLSHPAELADVLVEVGAGLV